MVDVRTTFTTKITDELCTYKELMMNNSKEKIFASSYEIELYVVIYEVLVDQVENMTDSLIESLLKKEQGVLKYIYDSWLLSKEDSFLEIKDYIMEEVA